MTAWSAPDELDLAALLRPDDLVVLEQGIGEPTAVVEQLLAQSAVLDGTEVFAGVSYSGVFTEAAVGGLNLLSFGAMGALSPLAATGRLGVIPCHWADVSRVLRARNPDGLVVVVQVAPADSGGYSLGLSHDYTHDLIAGARLVIAEVNDQMPVATGPRIPESAIDIAVPSSRPLAVVPTPAATDLHRRIAAAAVELVPAGATLQLGIGAVPAVVGGLLAGKRDLRVHSALVGDWLLDLDRAGALSAEEGAIALSSAAGSPELYERLAKGDVRFLGVPELSPPNVLAGVPRLVALNSALQVDLSGQVNAEVVGDRMLGGIGGQTDFLRGAQLSAGGRSIIMLPATAARGTASRIVAHLDQSVVTSPRSTADFVVTEYGTADLRGRTLTERAAALIAIAAPEHRETLWTN